MPKLFAAMRFRHPWRSYQARILDELEDHLDDRKLHVVAAPGAGKTVLGLEIIRRLGLRCIVLAPSILVRDQWIERLQADFLEDVPPDSLSDIDPPLAVSTELKADALIRVSTYQALHQMRGQSLPPVALLCLDEAHHLRRSWWQTLTHLAKAQDCTTLSLTATPPYDAVAHEWANYDALCGQIDAEISAPELVASGDLCPHQDLVYTAITSQGARYARNRQDEQALFDTLRADPAVLEMLAQTPWMRDCRAHADAILAEPDLFSAMLIYCHDAGRRLPDYALRLLQIRTDEMPRLSWSWLERLFTGLRDRLPADLVERLIRADALKHDRLRLPPPRFSERAEILRDDAARLRACLQIHDLEREIRAEGLRQAILVDRIGQVSLRAGVVGDSFNAARVFQALVQGGAYDDLAILTGQLIVLPRDICADLAGEDLPDAPGFRLIAAQAFDAGLVRANHAFAQGRVRVIIGTQAFLGQGWDAPALNSLVLGTNLSSFVAVNQLRGRALRIDRSAPDKTANIWHLAILPDTTVAGEDLEALARRFACFARIDREAGEIRSHFAPEASSEAQNAKVEALARRHATLAEDWASALRVDAHVGGCLMRESRVSWPRSRLVLPRRGGLVSWWRSLTGKAAPEAEVTTTLLRLGKVIIESLRQGDEMRRDVPIRPYVLSGAAGLRLGVERASRLEEGLFHDCLRDLLDPVDTPRYLIHIPGGLLKPRAQSFAVPRRFDANKRRAEIFWRNWQAMIGRGDLIFTRTIAGRGLLQSARLRTAGETLLQNLQWR